MKLNKLLLAAVIMLMANGSAWAISGTYDYTNIVTADKELDQKINQALLTDSKLTIKDWENIKVVVKNGTVALQGEVATDAAAKEIESIAQKYSNTKVNNQLSSNEAQKKKVLQQRGLL